ncbi:MAG: hypothetical protein ABEJ68_06625 [Halobacteriaceae archaeon]
MARTRAQSNVVGVALLVGVTAVSLGLVAASAGTVLDAQTARADTARVADGLDDAVRPAETTGVRERRLAIRDGSFETVPRELRILRGETVVAERSIGALRFENAEGSATFVAGAIFQRSGGTALRRPPGVRLTDGLLVVNAPTLRGDAAYAVSGTATVTVQTRVSHDRTTLGPGNYSVAIETASPAPFARHFEDRGLSVERRDFDGDGVESVVVAFPVADRLLLFTHRTEVAIRG